MAQVERIDVRDAANRMQHVPLAVARVEFSERVDYTFTLTGDEFTDGLDFNARLVTALIRRGVNVWGPEPEFPL